MPTSQADDSEQQTPRKTYKPVAVPARVVEKEPSVFQKALAALEPSDAASLVGRHDLLRELNEQWQRVQRGGRAAVRMCCRFFFFFFEFLLL